MGGRRREGGGMMGGRGGWGIEGFEYWGIRVIYVMWAGGDGGGVMEALSMKNSAFEEV